MSLKAVHICFIILAVLLAGGVGFWGIDDYLTSQRLDRLLLGSASLIFMVALAGYLFWFLSEMKKVSSP